MMFLTIYGEFAENKSRLTPMTNCQPPLKVNCHRFKPDDESDQSKKSKHIETKQMMSAERFSAV